MMPTIRQVLQHVQQGDYVFSIEHNVAYLHIPLIKHHHHFLHFVWQHKPLQWKVLPFGLATAPRVFSSLTKPILFLHRCKFFSVICLHDIWPDSKYSGKMAQSFLFSVGLSWITYYFSSLNFLTQCFSFWDYAGIQWICL